MMSCKIGYSDVQFVLGTLGIMASTCLFLLPIPTFMRIVNERSVGDYSGIPNVLTLWNCLLWTFYGLPYVKLHALLPTMNAAGCLIETSFLVVYLIYVERSSKVKVVRIWVAILITYMALIALVLKMVHERPMRKVIIGTLAAAGTSGMYISPFAYVRNVIRTRSVDCTTFLFSLFMFLNGLVWLCYTYVDEDDYFIFIPNGVGCVAGFVLLFIYILCFINKPISVTEESRLLDNPESQGEYPSINSEPENVTES